MYDLDMPESHLEEHIYFRIGKRYYSKEDDLQTEFNYSDCACLVHF